MAGNENSIGSMLANAADFGKEFLRYQFMPDTTLTKPNQRITPGIMTGYQYELQPGETVDELGRPYTADGQQIEFVDGPALMELLNLYPPVGSAVAPMKGAGTVLGAGPILKARQSDIVYSDPTVRDMVGSQIDASRKRSPYKLQGWDSLDVADKALTKMSMDPSQNALGIVDRAAELGHDTHMFHVTGHRYDPNGRSLKEGSVPWLESDPFLEHRGSVYTGNLPSAIVKSGAAVGSGGGENAWVYPMLLRAPIFGEHAIPEQLRSVLPDMLKFESTKPDAWATPGSISDIIAGLKQGEYMDEAREAWLAAKAASPFDNKSTAERMAQFDATYPTVARHFARTYYDPTMGGMGAGDSFIPVPGGMNQPGIPHYTTYEAGANAALTPKKYPGSNLPEAPGAHSPFQSILMGGGFTGSRIVDETHKVKDGKTIAMHYMPGIRSVNAKFDPRKADTNNLLAGVVPPGWYESLFQWQGEEQEPKL